MIFGKIHVHTADIPFHLVDAGRVLYHAHYLILFDLARSQALEQAGYPAAELWRDGYALALRENTSQYFKPAAYGQKIAVITVTEAAGGASIKLRQHMAPIEALPQSLRSPGFYPGDTPLPGEDELIHTAAMTLVCVKLDPVRSARLPEPLVEALNLEAARSAA